MLLQRQLLQHLKCSFLNFFIICRYRQILLQVRNITVCWVGLNWCNFHVFHFTLHYQCNEFCWKFHNDTVLVVVYNIRGTLEPFQMITSGWYVCCSWLKFIWYFSEITLWYMTELIYFISAEERWSA